MKLLKLFIGLGLLFPCVVLTQVLWELLLLARMQTGQSFPLPALALASGFFLWIVLFVLFPKPMRSYIFAHELTHALWGVFMGARVSRIDVQKDHGSVVLSKTNYLITLAPYFFPLYTILVILFYTVLRMFVNVQPYSLLWLGFVGFTWGFHITFTVNALMQRQTDVHQQGHLFSYTFIYLANVFGVCVWVVLVTRAGWLDLATQTFVHSQSLFALLVQICEVAIRRFQTT